MQRGLKADSRQLSGSSFVIHELRTKVRLGGPLGAYIGGFGWTFQEYFFKLSRGLTKMSSPTVVVSIPLFLYEKSRSYYIDRFPSSVERKLPCHVLLVRSGMLLVHIQPKQGCVRGM